MAVARRAPLVRLPASESKRDAFVRLAEKRTNAVIDKVRILSNLSNPYVYEWDEDDVRRIFAAIEQELKLAKLKFQARQKRSFQLT